MTIQTIDVDTVIVHGFCDAILVHDGRVLNTYDVQDMTFEDVLEHVLRDWKVFKNAGITRKLAIEQKLHATL